MRMPHLAAPFWAMKKVDRPKCGCLIRSRQSLYAPCTSVTPKCAAPKSISAEKNSSKYSMRRAPSSVLERASIDANRDNAQACATVSANPGTSLLHFYEKGQG